MFAVFIINGNEWKLHATYNNMSQAYQEKEYLINMLGLKAEVFKKV